MQKDATEIKNHFFLFKYMLDTIDDKLTENMIKKFHFILRIKTNIFIFEEYKSINQVTKKYI